MSLTFLDSSSMTTDTTTVFSHSPVANTRLYLNFESDTNFWFRLRRPLHRKYGASFHTKSRFPIHCEPYSTDFANFSRSFRALPLLTPTLALQTFPCRSIICNCSRHVIIFRLDIFAILPLAGPLRPITIRLRSLGLRRPPRLPSIVPSSFLTEFITSMSGFRLSVPALIRTAMLLWNFPGWVNYTHCTSPFTPLSGSTCSALTFFTTVRQMKCSITVPFILRRINRGFFSIRIAFPSVVSMQISDFNWTLWFFLFQPFSELNTFIMPTWFTMRSSRKIRSTNNCLRFSPDITISCPAIHHRAIHTYVAPISPPRCNNSCAWKLNTTRRYTAILTWCYCSSHASRTRCWRSTRCFARWSCTVSGNGDLSLINSYEACYWTEINH